MMNDNPPLPQKTPLDGVPGLSAAFYRCVYRLAMFEKRRLERNAPRRAAYQAALERQDLWSRENANPRADSIVTIFLWILALIVISLFFANRMKGTGQTEMKPNAPSIANSGA